MVPAYGLMSFNFLTFTLLARSGVTVVLLSLFCTFWGRISYGFLASVM